MPLYTVNHIDRCGRIWSSDQLECDTDASAVALGQLLDVRGVSDGFDVWEGERLVERHRRLPRPSA